MILFSLAENCFSGGKRRKREERKKRGKKTTAAAFLAGAWDAVVGSRERCSCQHIHMSSLFRHTLENVTSFQAWPGKGSTAEGGKAPDCGEPAPESCLPLCARMHMCAHDSLGGWCACGFCRLMTWALARQALTGSTALLSTTGGPCHSVAAQKSTLLPTLDLCFGNCDACLGAEVAWANTPCRRRISWGGKPCQKLPVTIVDLRWQLSSEGGTHGVLRLWEDTGGMRCGVDRQAKRHSPVYEGDKQAASHTKYRHSRILLPARHLASGSEG